MPPWAGSERRSSAMMSHAAAAALAEWDAPHVSAVSAVAA